MTTTKKIFQSTFLDDDRWEKMQSTIEKGKQPFKYVDRLEIAFARIAIDGPGNAYLEYDRPDRVKTTMAQAKAQNDGIEIIAQMDWAKHLAPLGQDEAKIRTFANSIPGFLKKYELKGIDFDWESVPSNLTEKYATYLFEQTRKALGPNTIMCITPAETKSLTSANLKLFDAVIPQSYYEDVLDYIRGLQQEFKLASSIVYCGICSEPGYPAIEGIEPWKKALNDLDLAGFYSWRIDNDDSVDLNPSYLAPSSRYGVPRYTITSQVWQALRGQPPQPPLYP